MEDARTLRARADRYRRLLWDVTDAQIVKSLQALIDRCEAQAAKTGCEATATADGKENVKSSQLDTVVA
jgi:hypothetical protein